MLKSISCCNKLWIHTLKKKNILSRCVFFFSDLDKCICLTHFVIRTCAWCRHEMIPQVSERAHVLLYIDGTSQGKNRAVPVAQRRGPRRHFTLAHFSTHLTKGRNFVLIVCSYSLLCLLSFLIALSLEVKRSIIALFLKCNKT